MYLLNLAMGEEFINLNTFWMLFMDLLTLLNHLSQLNLIY